MSAPPPEGLDQARETLRQLGYLDRRMERYLLQDALRPEAPWRTVPVLLAKVVLLAAIPAALVAALVVLALNGYLAASQDGAAGSVWDLLPLFLHLLVPTVALVGGAFLVLAGVLALLLRLLHRRRIETLSFALAAVAAVLTSGFLAWQGRELLPDLPRSLAVLGLLAMPLGAYGILRLTHDGLLGLAIRLTDQAPERPWRWGRALVGVLLGLVFLLGLPAYLAVRPEVGEPANLPLAAGERVLLIGVDGVRSSELEFLLAAGQLPELRRRVDAGALLAPYVRPPGSPSALWTSVATGVDAARHGMEAVDSYRPLGMSRSLLRGSWLRPYWHGLSTIGLAEYRAVLARERRVHTLWELLGRGGLPTLVVNWWGTFPVEPGAGWQLAHGAFQLLGDPKADAAAIAAPAGWGAQLADLRREEALPAGLDAGLEAALGPAPARLLREGALLPDVFYRDALRDGLRRLPETRVAAVYLPALDIAAAGLGAPTPEGTAALQRGGEEALGGAAFGELLRWQLTAVDALVAEVGSGFGTVVLVFDGGRRDAGRGALLIARREPCRPVAGPPLLPEHAAAAALRALGMAQSGELPEPPGVCAWPEPPLRVGTYGRRQSQRLEVDSAEYLHSLKSLGYL
jgi:hypothetical protein